MLYEYPWSAKKDDDHEKRCTMTREFIRVLVVMGLQLLTTFVEGAFEKAAEYERRNRNDEKT